MWTNTLQQDMSFTALETHATKELNEKVHSASKENADTCSSNGKSSPEDILLFHGNLQTDVVGKLSQSLQEIDIETTKQIVPDVEQVSDHDEGCAGLSIGKLETAGLNTGSVATRFEEESEFEVKEDMYPTKPNSLTVLEEQKGQVPTFPMTSSKCMAQAATGVKHAHEEAENCKPLTRMLLNRNNAASKCSSVSKASSSKCTIARPFALATDKRAQERPATSATVPNCPSDIPQDVKTLRQKLFVAKSSRTDIIKPSLSHQQHKGQRNATGFSFRSDERAKKRKEFYSKLQEKFHAQEEERTQMQARTEKENEEALKELRRSLTFRASPMPSFYQEGPPPKVELTKVPTTQAKSPNFSARGRRVGSESVSNGVCEVKTSHSNGLQQHMNVSDEDLLQERKDSIMGRLAECSLVDSSSERSSTSNPFSSSSSRGGVHVSDEENEVNHKGISECEHLINNQKLSEGNKAKRLVKGAVATKPSFERHDRYGNNVLTNCANYKASPISSARPTKMKPKVEPLPYDMKEDVSPVVNKTTKRERLKALTPYFRKRESIGSATKRTAGIPAKELATDLDANTIAGTG